MSDGSRKRLGIRNKSALSTRKSAQNILEGTRVKIVRRRRKKNAREVKWTMTVRRVKVSFREERNIKLGCRLRISEKDNDSKP